MHSDEFWRKFPFNLFLKFNIFACCTEIWITSQSFMLDMGNSLISVRKCKQKFVLRLSVLKLFLENTFD